MRISSVIEEINNIKTYQDDIYDIIIVLDGNRLGNKIFFKRGIILEHVKRYIIDVLRKYCDENCYATLYQGCIYKSDLLLLISDR